MERDVLEVPVDGARLHIEAHGPREAPRVMMLHGALAVGRSMLGQAFALKDRYRVLLVDQRGHGASTRFGEPGNGWERLAMPQLVADGEALLDALRPAALVGVSLGGIVSAHLAARRPADAQALALLSAAPRDSAARRAYFARATPEGFPEGQQALWARWHGDGSGGSGSGSGDGDGGGRGRGGGDAYWRELARRMFAALSSRGDEDYARERLRAFGGPALVLAGAEDALVPPREADEYREWLPQADIRIVPGDHSFFAGAGRHDANAALRAFLDGALAP